MIVVEKSTEVILCVFVSLICLLLPKVYNHFSVMS